LDDRFFTLLVFMHIVLPLLLLLVLWIHLQRVSRPRINSARGLAAGMFLTMLALSLVKPALSQGPADLATVPALVGLDWFYLGFYPLLESWPGAATWGLAGALTLMLAALPWLPPLRRAPVAVVDLANCNGCTRCAADCPYNAITMVPRTDGRPSAREAAVDPSLCVSCGICAGACPTSMPFRRASELVLGIDLPGLTIAALRERVHGVAQSLTRGPRIMVFGCDHGVEVERARDARVAAVRLACIGHLPPAFIDYVLSRDLADGIFLTGCADGFCYNRFGIAWTAARLAGERDPHLRARVPRERLTTLWLGRRQDAELKRAVDEFASRLAGLETPKVERRAPAPAELHEISHG
jgi:ferredoxin/coenzyme F420-reducing hydrogenase delta subunit